MKKSILFILALLVLAPTGFAQFFDLTQPNRAPLRFNPGFTGSLKDTRVTTIFRNRSLGVPLSNKSAYVAYDQLSNILGGGIGGDFSYTNLGPGYEVNLGANYAAKFHLGGRWTLSPGIRVHTRFSKYQVYINYPNVPQEYVTRRGGSLLIMPGIVLNTSNFYLGASIDNLPRFRLSAADSLAIDIGDKKPAYILQAGYNYSPSPNSSWSIATSVTARRSSWLSLLQPQVVFLYKSILVGTGLTIGHRGENQAISPLLPIFTNTQDPFISLGYKHKKFRVNASLTLPQKKTGNTSILEVGATMYLSRKLKNAGLAIF